MTGKCVHLPALNRVCPCHPLRSPIVHPCRWMWWSRYRDKAIQNTSGLQSPWFCFLQQLWGTLSFKKIIWLQCFWTPKAEYHFSLVKNKLHKCICYNGRQDTKFHQRQKRCNGIDIVHHSNMNFTTQLMSDLILSKLNHSKAIGGRLWLINGNDIEFYSLWWWRLSRKMVARCRNGGWPASSKTENPVFAVVNDLKQLIAAGDLQNFICNRCRSTNHHFDIQMSSGAIYSIEFTEQQLNE